VTGKAAGVRIAFDIAALDNGGAERQTLEVASGLSEAGHEVLLVVNKGADHFSEYFDRIRIVELDRTERWDLRVIPDIRAALRAFRPHVTVCVLFNASLFGRLAAASLGCPVVVAEHSTKVRTPLPERATNVALGPVTSAVIACARAQVDALVRGGHQRRKVHVVPNGVSITRFVRDRAGAAAFRAGLGIPEDAPVVLLAAGHRREKRHDRFISLVERLQQAGVAAWGVMAGGGPLLEQTRSLAAASPVAERLRVAGPLVDMPAAYSAADVAVLVSDDIETFPLSFLEAQACEVPVVGMDTGGVRETMIDGQTGFVVGQGDLQAMAAATAALLTAPTTKATMGDAGRRFVSEHLSIDAMVRGYAAVLAGAAGGGWQRRQAQR
jgi:glycosyltransferase involved in cell wall biosynthesis